MNERPAGVTPLHNVNPRRVSAPAVGVGVAHRVDAIEVVDRGKPPDFAWADGVVVEAHPLGQLLMVTPLVGAARDNSTHAGLPSGYARRASGQSPGTGMSPMRVVMSWRSLDLCARWLEGGARVGATVGGAPRSSLSSSSS